MLHPIILQTIIFLLILNRFNNPSLSQNLLRNELPIVFHDNRIIPYVHRPILYKYRFGIIFRSTTNIMIIIIIIIMYRNAAGCISIIMHVAASTRYAYFIELISLDFVIFFYAAEWDTRLTRVGRFHTTLLFIYVSEAFEGSTDGPADGIDTAAAATTTTTTTK